MSRNEISKNRKNISDKNFYSFFLTVPSLSSLLESDLSTKFTKILNFKEEFYSPIGILYPC